MILLLLLTQMFTWIEISSAAKYTCHTSTTKQTGMGNENWEKHERKIDMTKKPCIWLIKFFVAVRFCVLCVCVCLSVCGNQRKKNEKPANEPKYKSRTLVQISADMNELTSIIASHARDYIINAAWEIWFTNCEKLGRFFRATFQSTAQEILPTHQQHQTETTTKIVVVFVSIVDLFIHFFTVYARFC